MMDKFIIMNGNSTEPPFELKVKSDSNIKLIGECGEEASWKMDDDLNVTIDFKRGSYEGHKIKMPICYISDIFKLYKAFEQTKNPIFKFKIYKEL